jgi:hypothetical protein
MFCRLSLVSCLVVPVALSIAPTAQAQARQRATLETITPLRTPAFRTAAQRHAAAMMALPATHSAGLWIVQDAHGRLIDSGILDPFPTKITSDNYGQVVPGAAGKVATEFGFSRTLGTAQRPSFRAVYVTVAAGS